MAKRRSNYTYRTVPNIYRRRNSFPIGHERLLSMSVGELTPVDIIEINPGDGIHGKIGMISRLLNAYYKPVVGSTFIDTHVFFVPFRLIYDRWEEVMGENKQDAWAQQNPVDVPTFDDLESGDATVVTDSVYDHLVGVPAGSYSAKAFKLSVLPARAFALIYNYWYRNENITPPMRIQKGEVVASELPNSNEWSSANYAGMLPKVNKLKDRFTSALPAPQKGDPVYLNPGINQIPVLPLDDGFNQAESFSSKGVHVRDVNGDSIGSIPLITNGGASDSGYLHGGSETPGTVNSPPLYFDNLFAVSPEGGALSIDVSRLRMAVQLQRILERSARYGTRYLSEYIPSTFGIQSRAMFTNYPEYICGWSQPMGVHQVAQTGVDKNGTGVADLAAFGQTAGRGRISKTFTEHGYLIVCSSIRQIHVYQQGVQPMFFRKGRFDFYDTELARISEQPIYKREIFFGSGESGDEPAIFGYGEPWSELRSMPNAIRGQMRSGSTLRDGKTQSNFDLWHFGDDYENAPTLNDGFIKETRTYVDRTIQNMPTDGSMDEFLVQYYFSLSRVAELPIYGVPGLLDHTYTG